MLTILLNAQTALDIDAETNITLEYENPMFIFDALPGMASYQFTIPASPTNNNALQHANNINTNTANNTAFPAQVQVNGIPLLNGYLTIDAATPYRYTCTLQTDFLQRLRDVNLADQFKQLVTTEIDFPGWFAYTHTQWVYDSEDYGALPADLIAHFNAANAGTYPAYSHAFPVFYSETFYAQGATHPAVPDTWQSPYPHNYFNLITTGETPIDPDSIVPWFYVVYVVLASMAKQDLTVTGNIDTDAEFNTLLLYGNYSQDNWVLDTNFYNNSIQPARSLPPLTLADFLLDLRKKFNIIFFFGLNESSVDIWFAKDLAANAPVVDLTQYTEPLYSIQFNETIGNITLCHTEDDYDNYDAQFDADTADFIISGAEANIDQLPASAQPNELYLVTTENAWYKWEETDDPDNPGTSIKQWARYSYNYPCYNANAQNTTQIESSLPMLMQEQQAYLNANPNATWVTPRIELLGNTFSLLSRWAPMIDPDAVYTYRMLNNKFGIRYAFYRGLQPDSTMALGTEYALATPTPYNAAGTQVGNYSLDFNGTNGIYAQFWQPFIKRVATTKIVEKTLNLSAYQLSQLSLSNKFQVQETTGLCHYFIKKLTINITATGIESTKAVMVQII